MAYSFITSVCTRRPGEDMLLGSRLCTHAQSAQLAADRSQGTKLPMPWANHSYLRWPISRPGVM